MGDKSGIEWTDATWNPVTGCSHVSDGCRFCYAETLTRRFSDVWGAPDLPWTAGNAEANVILHPERLEQPLKWRRPRTVFVNSMSDLFHERIPPEFVAYVFAVMTMAQQHTFQVLTKRPERMYLLLTDARFWFAVADVLRARDEDDEAHALTRAVAGGAESYVMNVWLGVSIESRRHIDRADALRRIPAAHRFISAEPLLGPLVLRREGHGIYWNDGWGSVDDPGPASAGLDLRGIDWLIAGGESGEHFAERPDRFLVDASSGGRPTAAGLEWMRLLRDACKASGTHFMLKQWGGRTPKSGGRELDGRTHDWTPLSAGELVA